MAQISELSDLVGCSTVNFVFLFFLQSTQTYYGANISFSNRKYISREYTDAVFLLIFPDGLKYVEEIKLNKCMYIEDTCLERLSSIENLQESLYMMEVVSCGNVTDKGVIALYKLR